MHVSPDPITTREQAAQERETLLDLIARGLYCTTAGALGTDHTEPSAEVLTQGRRVADDYLSAYEEWLVKLSADNAS
ncbi:hypothetical protein ACIG0A_33785 [Streptomyces californicus]|uniref:hypothetical protein n=1 Tax=Streptomyces californicus TaxID=67351 RepID=UPI0037D41545